MNILQYVEIFLAVADNNSFTRAAELLSMSKGAVSQAVKQLETLLKASLFIRTTRKVFLSDEGVLFYKQSLRLKHEADALMDLSEQFQQSPKGLLRVFCNPHFAKAKLPPILRSYMTKFPNVSLEILCDERMPDMQKEQVDVVFWVNTQAPDDIVARVIGTTRYVLCASPEYLAINGTPKTIEELDQHEYFSHLGRDPQTPFVYIKTNPTVKIKNRLKLNNVFLMKSLAKQGLGIVQLHDYMVEKSIANGELVEILAEYSQPNIPLYIYFQKHRFVQPKIREFINLVVNPKN